MGNFITFAAAIFVIIEADTIDPSQVGLIITYALSVTQVLNWLVRMTADVETNIVAVERIKVKYLISLIFDKYPDGVTDYGRPVRKSPSLHGKKSNPNPKFIDTDQAYFVCPIGPKFQISLVYAFIGSP